MEFQKLLNKIKEFKISLPDRYIFSFKNIRLCDYKDNNERVEVLSTTTITTIINNQLPTSLS